MASGGGINFTDAGLFGLAPGFGGDVTTTREAYVARLTSPNALSSHAPGRVVNILCGTPAPPEWRVCLTRHMDAAPIALIEQRRSRLR